MNFGLMFGVCIKTEPLLMMCPRTPQKTIIRWEHPDLVLCYFWLFSELKIALKIFRHCQHYRTWNDIPEERF
jgi:hypothetical protein